MPARPARLMQLLLGWLIVAGAVLGGFMMAGGKPATLIVISEYVILCGVAVGFLVAGATTMVLKDTLGRVLEAVKGASFKKQDFLDLISVLYEVLLVAREKGIVGIEEHVSDPHQSSLFQRYPSILKRHHLVEFLQEAFKPVIAGKVKPEQMQEIMHRKYERLVHHNAVPVSLLLKIADAMPGIGIVAAVLGIIITMGHLGGDKASVGASVAHALVGTFLGILISYGFMQPLATRIELMCEEEVDYYRVAGAIIVSYVSGAAPIVAADAGREFIPHDRAIEPDALEKLLKELKRA